jgi:hypothetical protein
MCGFVLGEAVTAPARGDGFLLGEKSRAAGHAGGFFFCLWMRAQQVASAARFLSIWRLWITGGFAADNGATDGFSF